MKNLHVVLELTLNNEDWSWNEPRVHRHVTFQVPLMLADSTAIGKLIASEIKELEAQFPEAVKAFEEKQAEEAKAKEGESS